MRVYGCCICQPVRVWQMTDFCCPSPPTVPVRDCKGCRFNERGLRRGNSRDRSDNARTGASSPRLLRPPSPVGSCDAAPRYGAPDRSAVGLRHAKYADAINKISFACRSSRFSRSGACGRAFRSGAMPPTQPLSRSARLTHDAVSPADSRSCCDRGDGSPAEVVFAFVFKDYPDRVATHFSGKPVRRPARHGSIRPGAGTSGKPGAVHSGKSSRQPACLHILPGVHRHPDDSPLSRARCRGCAYTRERGGGARRSLRS